MFRWIDGDRVLALNEIVDAACPMGIRKHGILAYWSLRFNCSDGVGYNEREYEKSNILPFQKIQTKIFYKEKIFIHFNVGQLWLSISFRQF